MRFGLNNSAMILALIFFIVIVVQILLLNFDSLSGIFHFQKEIIFVCILAMIYPVFLFQVHSRAKPAGRMFPYTFFLGVAAVYTSVNADSAQPVMVAGALAVITLLGAALLILAERKRVHAARDKDSSSVPALRCAFYVVVVVAGSTAFAIALPSLSSMLHGLMLLAGAGALAGLVAIIEHRFPHPATTRIRD
jgi:hypothetical protein